MVHVIAESDMTEQLTLTYLRMNISPETFAI